MTSINVRLKDSIKNSKFTQKEIASILNTSQNTLSSYTQGKASIPVETLKLICELIGVSLNSIVYGNEDTTLNKNELIIINNFRNLNEKNRIKVEGYIEGLLNEQNNNNGNLSTSMSIESIEGNKKSS